MSIEREESFFCPVARGISARVPLATRLLFCTLSVCWYFFGSCPVQAELPSIRFDRLTPLGGAAGSTVTAEIAGADIEGVKSLLFDHPGLKAELVKDHQFKIAI